MKLLKRILSVASAAAVLICGAAASDNGAFFGNISITASAADYSYSSDYVYNMFETDAERTFYDRLLKCAVEVDNSSYDYTQTPYVPFSDLINSQLAMEIAGIFVYDHPEFFWIDSGLTTSSLSGLSFDIISEFQDGSYRSSSKKKIESIEQQYISGASEYRTDYEKAKFLHDALLNNVIYKSGEWDQSVASVFLQEETVCAGFAKAYSLLCNACGIDVVSYRGCNHAWNGIKLGGKWYLVDVTFDNEPYYYEYFLLSDSEMRDKDEMQGEMYNITVIVNGVVQKFELYEHDSSPFNNQTYYSKFPKCRYSYVSNEPADDEPSDIGQIQGDINRNGEIDLYDAIAIAKYLIGSRTFTDEEKNIADYDGSGNIDLYDCIGIATYLLTK